jgi:peptide/nickel transport system permease protein
VQLKAFPATGWVPISENLGQNLRSAFLPALTLSIAQYGTYTRVLRADLIAQLRQGDYVLTAQAKGAAPLRVVVRHALRNSVFALITVVGLSAGTMMSGAVIVETLFGVPGLGQALINGIFARDVNTVQGIVVLVAVTFVLINFLVDLTYALLDPRIRHARASG